MDADVVEYERCRNLWRAIVWRAIEDALWIDPLPGTPITIVRTVEGERRRREASAAASARRWLREGGSDFRAVCDLAELEYPDIQKLVEKYIKAGTSWDELTRQGDVENCETELLC